MTTPTAPRELRKWTQEAPCPLVYMEGGRSVSHSWTFRPPEGGVLSLSFAEDPRLDGGAELHWDSPTGRRSSGRIFLFRLGAPNLPQADLASRLLAAAFEIGLLKPKEEEEDPSVASAMQFPEEFVVRFQGRCCGDCDFHMQANDGRICCRFAPQGAALGPHDMIADPILLDFFPAGSGRSLRCAECIEEYGGCEE